MNSAQDIEKIFITLLNDVGILQKLVKLVNKHLTINNDMIL